jgi:hypothetical protein
MTTKKQLEKELRKAKAERAIAKERRRLKWEIAAEKVGAVRDPLEFFATEARGFLSGGEEIARKLNVYAENVVGMPSDSSDNIALNMLEVYQNANIVENESQTQKLWKYLLNEE